MSEASSEPRWRLTFWSETGGHIIEFDFDVEPEFTAEEIVASYYGEREGRTVRVHVTMDKVAVWSLEELPR